MLGRFLELSVPSARILESWQFYQRLGFTPAIVGEIWPHRYSVVTDGRLALGLHDEGGVRATLLTYVLPELARHLPALEALGIEFDRRQLGDDAFNEAEFTAPDGHHVRIVEARTYSPPDAPPPTRLGWFEELALPVADLGSAREFWERLGFVTAAEGDDPWPHLSLTSDTLDIGLYRTRELKRPTLVYSAEDGVKLREQLTEAGIEPEERLPPSLDPAAHLLVLAPEGTPILIGPPPG